MMLHRGVLLLGMLTAVQTAPQDVAPPPKAVEKKAAPRKAVGPPEVPIELKAKPGQMIRVSVKTDAEIGTLRNFTDTEAFWGELVSPKGTRQFVFQAPADGKRSTFVVGWWTKGELEGTATTITVEGVAPTPLPVPPEPNPPEPKPPTPVPPTPAKTFQVLVIYESGATHSAGQKAVMEGKVVEDWLNANCTGGKTGWARVDKDFPVEKMPAQLRELWAVTKLAVTGVPCVAIARDTRVSIEPLATTPAAMVDVLNRLKGGM